MLPATAMLWLTLSLLTAFSSVIAGPISSPVVQVRQTTFQGLYNETTGVESFRGIRYGSASRFRRGVRTVYGSKQTVNSTFYGVACPQIRGTNALAVDYGIYGTSEDCLILDVYRPPPKGGAGKGLPVMVWLHGGALTQGAASNYPGAGMVSESMAINLPVIVVSINYRLASWGFLGGKEASVNGAQNLGLYDQQDALSWVQSYISSFGGDPARVTVFGQSSGAMSIAYHMLDVNTKLFSAAILQSGASTSVPALPAEKYQGNYEALVNFVGCSTARNKFECLRTVDQAILLNATNSMFQIPATYGSRPWGVTIDGRVIPGSPSALTAQKKIANIPTLNGNVRDEGTIFVKPQTVMNTADYIAFLNKDYLNRNATFFDAENAGSVNTLLSLYPEDPKLGAPFNGESEPFFGPQFKRAAATYGDLHFQAPRRNWIDALTSKNLNVWSYQFETAAPGGAPWQGVYHTSEIPYVFMKIEPSYAQLYAFSKQCLAYWVSFAYNHDPNHKSYIGWPQYGKALNTMRLIAGGPEIIPDTYRKQETDFLRGVAGQFLESPV